MREWLTVIIALLILGVLLDGIRRMRAHRRETLKMSRRMNDDVDEVNDEHLSSSEFPSGGARVAQRREPEELENVNQNLRESYVASKQTRGAPNRIPEQVSLNLDTSVPMLMESVEPNREDDDEEPRGVEPSIGNLADLDASQTDDVMVSDPAEQPAEPSALDSPNQDTLSEPRKPSAGQSHKKRERTPEKPEAQEGARAPDEVLIINVMARKGEMFQGPALLDAMVSQGLRFGDMDIFHRHESTDGSGKILFSVANIVVPGTFEVGAMENFQSPGVSMFLSLPIETDSLTAFDHMAEAAQSIAKQLGGELKDENRSVMTKQTIEHSRQRVIEYERRRRLAK